MSLVLPSGSCTSGLKFALNIQLTMLPLIHSDRTIQRVRVEFQRKCMCNVQPPFFLATLHALQDVRLAKLEAPAKCSNV